MLTLETLNPARTELQRLCIVVGGPLLGGNFSLGALNWNDRDAEAWQLIPVVLGVIAAIWANTKLKKSDQEAREQLAADIARRHGIELPPSKLPLVPHVPRAIPLGDGRHAVVHFPTRHSPLAVAITQPAES